MKNNNQQTGITRTSDYKPECKSLSCESGILVDNRQDKLELANSSKCLTTNSKNSSNLITNSSRPANSQEKQFEDFSKEQQELIKEIVIERIKLIPSNLRLSIG